MMFTNKNILAIGAHPDDIEYAILGTLMKADNCRVYCYVASQGGWNDISSGTQRKKESNKALESILPEEIFWANRIGVDLSDYPTFVHSIESFLVVKEINLVLTHTKHDTHQDHRLLHDITMTALRNSQASVLFYNALSKDAGFSPNFFVDITDVFEKKQEALACHESQKDKYYMQKSFIKAWHLSIFTGRYIEEYEVGRIFQ